MSPVTRCSSEWHMPEAAKRTSTSPFFGRIELDGLHAPASVALPQDGSFGLHGASQDRVTTLEGYRLGTRVRS